MICCIIFFPNFVTCFLCYFVVMCKSIKALLFFVSLLFFVTCCEREYSFRGGEKGLFFSTDTITFDTIFTAIGSATHYLIVYNPYAEDMTIETIRLAGGNDSKFKLNINGFPENQMNDVLLNADDSLFIFVEITIDPSETTTSFLAEDSILFFTKERVQSVKLEAYVQDVVLLKAAVIKEDMKFTDEKPYLIYDSLIVSATKTLIIASGARLHFYKNAYLKVAGTLVVEGTKENPVLFAGHRLEEFYLDKPGQWGYIHLQSSSKNNKINYAVIRNGFIGLRVDSVGLAGDAPLLLSNTIIDYIATNGLEVQTSAIEAYNCVFGNCGGASVALTIGGKYNFYHCTIGNFQGFRNERALVISNYYNDKVLNKNIIEKLEAANFYNTIIYGVRDNEIILDFKRESGTEVINWQFDHVLMRTTASDDSLKNPNFINIINNKDPNFVNYFKSNFQLDTLSAAKDKGNIKIVQEKFELLGKDLLENFRDERPDLGAYERME